VLVVKLVEREPLREIARITTRLFGPRPESSSEVEVDHHTAEIEEQGADRLPGVEDHIIHLNSVDPAVSRVPRAEHALPTR
jgi:hypothetical protein